MAYEPRPGEGALFINKRHTGEPEDRSPHREGYIVAHRDIRQGEKLQLAGWIKKTEGKNPLLSLRMSDARPKRDEL